jgi:isohexenylglutaconyl-CoA hydratase
MTAGTKSLPETTQISLNIEDGVMHLTLNRPESRNAINSEMVSEVIAVFRQLAALEVRTVVLRGAGGNFCAGADIKDMNALIKHAKSNELDAIAKINGSAGTLFHTVNNAPQAVVAVVEGAVMGGGMGIACSADIVIAMANTKFALPETGLGLLPAQVAPFVRNRIGNSYARLLAVQGGQFDAEQAHRFGLVHYVVKDETELQETLAQVLKKIKGCAPKALATAKALMMPDSLLKQDPESLGMLFAKAMVGDEAQEGTQAFIEKRKPKWAT